jgi:hypothetical protein
MYDEEEDTQEYLLAPRPIVVMTTWTFGCSPGRELLRVRERRMALVTKGERVPWGGDCHACPGDPEAQFFCYHGVTK